MKFASIVQGLAIIILGVAVIIMSHTNMSQTERIAQITDILEVLSKDRSNESAGIGFSGGNQIIIGPISPDPSTPNPLEAARLCVVCGKQKTRDFHGGLEYKAYGGNTGSVCTTFGCDLPYVPYCDDHSPEKEKS